MGPSTNTVSRSNYVELVVDCLVERPIGDFALHGSIRPAPDQDYPATRAQSDAVTITYTAGYGTAVEDVPAGIQTGVLMLVEDLYRDRGSQIEGSGRSNASWTAKAVLSPFMAPRRDIRTE